MRNAMVFDELRQKDLEREMIFSSISSFICRFSVDGKLEWCNSPRLLQEVLGVAERGGVDLAAARPRLVHAARADAQPLAPARLGGGVEGVVVRREEDDLVRRHVTVHAVQDAIDLVIAARPFGGFGA